jgi:predicted SprT family Zn-dependent metalloprotease
MTPTAALRMARGLMDRHGLRRWTVRTNKGVHTVGVCRHKPKEIVLSSLFIELNTRAEVEDVILHEIAHAMSGWKAYHGPKWKRVARQIGARPETCTSQQAVHPPPRWVLRCPKCGYREERHRRPWRAPACGACCDRYACGRFDERFTLVCEDQNGNPIAYHDEQYGDEAVWRAKHTCSLCGYLLSRRKCTNPQCRGPQVVVNK